MHLLCERVTSDAYETTSDTFGSYRVIARQSSPQRTFLQQALSVDRCTGKFLVQDLREGLHNSLELADVHPVKLLVGSIHEVKANLNSNKCRRD